jgi:phosphocarrier protein
MTMAQRRATVATAEGLHARPAALFVKAAAESGVAVRVAKVGTDKAADARSILAVLALDVRRGDEVVLSADGDGADEALDRLAAMLSAAHE